MSTLSFGATELPVASTVLDSVNARRVMLIVKEDLIKCFPTAELDENAVEILPEYNFEDIIKRQKERLDYFVAKKMIASYTLKIDYPNEKIDVYILPIIAKPLPFNISMKVVPREATFDEVLQADSLKEAQ